MRHIVIPDVQMKPGVPTDHIGWAAQAIVEYRPDVLIIIGDFWDCPSLESYSEPGSLEREGRRFQADIEVGNEQFARLVAPMEAEQARLISGKRKHWDCRKVVTFGNHENRAVRVVSNNPKFEGLIGMHMFDTRDFERHDFLELVEIDGITYSHYFANTHSGRPIGGTIPNRLNKIGRSFVCGHEQGLLYGRVPYPGSLTRHGLVAGSFYLHNETYRGPQGRDEWRGIVVLNEVENGNYDVMPLSMNYLRKKYS